MKELEDYTWFPQSLRQYQTDFIGWLAARSSIYAPLAPIIEVAKPEKIIDLCTGNGAPMIYLAQKTRLQVPILLTDKFPHQHGEAKLPRDSNIQFLGLSYDALSEPFEKNAYYTMFNAFHHFNTDEQQNLVQRMQTAGASFLFVEILQPNALEFVKIAMTTTLGQFLLAPFIRPFSWARLFWTWLLPINLITVTIDGLISVSKSETPKGFRDTLAPVLQAMSAGYQVEVLQIKSRFFTTLTIIKGSASSH